MTDPEIRPEDAALAVLAAYPRTWRVRSERYDELAGELLVEFRQNGKPTMATIKLTARLATLGVSFQPTGTTGWLAVRVVGKHNAVTAREVIQAALADGWKLVP